MIAWSLELHDKKTRPTGAAARDTALAQLCPFPQHRPSCPAADTDAFLRFHAPRAEQVGPLGDRSRSAADAVIERTLHAPAVPPPPSALPQQSCSRRVTDAALRFRAPQAEQVGTPSRYLSSGWGEQARPASAPIPQAPSHQLSCTITRPSPVLPRALR